MGPDLAAFNPTQMAGFQNQIDAAEAFGLGGGGAPMQSLGQAQDFGGVQGYSAFPIFEQAQQELAARDPAQQAKYDALFGKQVPGNSMPGPSDYAMRIGRY